MKPMTLGGMVLEEELAITGISKAANAQVSAAYHGYSVGDEVYFTGQAGMAEINGRTARVVSVIDASNFTIDLNTTSFGTWTANAGGTTRTAPAPPPPPPPPVPPPSPAPSTPPIGNPYGEEGTQYNETPRYWKPGLPEPEPLY
jgi:hypothetical protein